MPNPTHPPIKIALIGDAQSGKSALIQRLTTNTHSDDYAPTPHFDFQQLDFALEGSHVPCTLIEFTESSKSSMSAFLANGVDILFFVVDNHNEEAWNNVTLWTDYISTQKANWRKQDFVNVILANKADLNSYIRTLANTDPLEGNEPPISIFPVSAKTGYGVNDAMEAALQQHYLKNAAMHPEKRSFFSRLPKPKNEKTKVEQEPFSHYLRWHTFKFFQFGPQHTARARALVALLPLLSDDEKRILFKNQLDLLKGIIPKEPLSFMPEEYRAITHKITNTIDSDNKGKHDFRDEIQRMLDQLPSEQNLQNKV